MTRLRNLVSIIILFNSGFVYGQEISEAKELFRSDDIIDLKISMNVNEAIKDVKIRDSHDATLTYKKPDGTEKVFKIKVTVRGNSRTNTKVCRFPPLKLNFKKKSVANTIFDGQNKLKLVTHCNARPINEEYILREYYVYKLQQLITPYCFKVRLCKISYEDLEGKYEPTPHYGFLIEDIDDLAERNGMIEYTKSLPNQEVCERLELDRLMFFQYLTGNLDWSIPNRHNFKIIANPDNPIPIAVPYDYDYTGIVNTAYAQVPEGIDVPNVRTRVFRGLCRLEGGYDATMNFYQDLKPEIYALYQDSEYLSDKSKTTTIKFLDSFYKVLDNPKMFEQQIVKACRANHQHMFEY